MKAEKQLLKAKPRDCGEASLVEEGTIWIGSKWHACTQDDIKKLGRLGMAGVPSRCPCIGLLLPFLVSFD